MTLMFQVEIDDGVHSIPPSLVAADVKVARSVPDLELAHDLLPSDRW
jgi:hypothetical protein